MRCEIVTSACFRNIYSIPLKIWVKSDFKLFKSRKASEEWHAISMMVGAELNV